jgi:cation transport ATPase
MKKFLSKIHYQTKRTVVHVAIEAADIVIMTDEPSKKVAAIK